MNRILFFACLATWLLQSCNTEQPISVQAQFKSDTISISNFLKSNNPQAIELSSGSGLWYSIDTLGNGVYPVLSDSVTISYTAKLIVPAVAEADLVKVDYSPSTTVLLSGAISGLQQVLTLFPANSYGRIYIPSGLAFGTTAVLDTLNYVKIRPNSNLLYEVKVISVNGTRLTSDITAIDAYLQNNSIVAQQDDSEIRYTIDAIDSTAINPPKPGQDDFITVTYTEKILNADTVISSVNTPVKIALKDQVTGWRVMLPKYLAEGSTMTLYIPSGYAYGSSASTTIPANSNLVYVITLIKVN